MSDVNDVIARLRTAGDPKDAVLAEVLDPQPKEEAKAEMTAAEFEERVRTTKAKIAQILSRGQSTARLQNVIARLPKDRYPVFARNREEDIELYKQLGFRVETGLEGIEGITASADNRVIIGDVILMTTSVENAEIIRTVEADLVREKLDLERTNYRNVENQGGVPTFDNTITQRG